jgi:hypothetical protein
MLSGRAWSDACFPVGACDGPALKTNHGSFLLKRPYTTADDDPLVTGIFRATLHTAAK